MAELSAEPITSLYVHVPFCVRKCLYCAFYSEPGTSELFDRYVSALIRELELVATNLKPRTIYFGGGTPTLLSLRQWERVLGAMDRLRLGGAGEWTVESNPATISLDKAKLLRSRGVNRISLGIQSFDESLLDRLGRVHTRQMAFHTFDLLRQAGFDNVNLDLMFAIPGQTLAVWRDTLAEALALGSEHLSSYEVIYEEDTPLYEELHAGKIDADEDLACAMYEELVERAAHGGFQQYEVANFARTGTPPNPPLVAHSPLPPASPQTCHEFPLSPSEGKRAGVRGPLPRLDSSVPSPAATAPELPSRACLHNVNYWRGGSFYGLGPSATSYVRGVRTKAWSNTRHYCEQLERGQRPLETREELTPLARAGETAAFGLRMVQGWPFEQFLQVTGYDLCGEWAGDMDKLVQQGWGCLLPGRFHLTPRGLRFADAAAQLFLR